MEWPPDLAFDELTYNECPFWVQVHVLRPNQINKQNALAIGDFLGKYIDVDLSQDGLVGFPHYLRVRADIKLDTPFPIGFNNRPDGRTHWVHFKYEKLQDIRYTCGVTGHLSRNCILNTTEGTPDEPNKGKSNYDPWLKAPTTNAIKTQPTRVANEQ